MDENTAVVRERILDASDALFYGRGIQSASMDEIRTNAGVSLKSLYKVFPSKESIVLAVLRRRHDTWTSGVNERVGRETDPQKRLLAIYDYLSDWFADDSFRGCGFINAFGELGSVSPAVAEAARVHKVSFQVTVASLVAEAGAPAELAPQLAILAEGAQTTAAISGTADAAMHARRAGEVLITAAMAAARP